MCVQRFKAFQSVFRPEPLVYQQFLDAMDISGASLQSTTDDFFQ
jgi:hypothetical protein